MLRLRILLQSKYLYLIILLIIVLFGLFRIYVMKFESKYNGNETIIKGKIINITKGEDKYNLTILAKEKLKATYYFKEDINLELGMIVLLEGELNPPMNNTVPNNFNYRKYLNNHHIYYLMKITKLHIIENNHNIVYKVKNTIYDYIEKNDYKGYLKVLLVGDKSDMDVSTYETYQNNGLAHLLAVSGMHINLIAAFLLIIFKKYKYKNLLIMAFLILYVSLTNYTASILRSLLFFVLLSINKKYDFKISGKNILFLTVSLLILYDPLIIYDLGFQYSVLVTYGLIITATKIKQNYFRSILIISINAFLFSLPITLMTSYEINLLNILNNILLGPLISIIVFPLAFFSLLLKILSPLFIFSVNIIEYLNSILNSIKIMIVIPKVNFVFYLFYYILLIIYVNSNNKKYVIAGLILILSFKLKYYLDFKTYLYFVDVGQGDSALIYNNKEAILIDTGGIKDYQVSNNTIRMMKSFGVSKIDLIILTHGDADHLLDTQNIVDKIKVKRIMINNNQVNELEEEIIKGAPNIINKYSGQFNLTIINEDHGKDENLSSIITLLEINNHNILFMGDAPKEREKKLIKDYEIKADIIKLGHHGSKTSSDYQFLKNIGVKEAIISSGRNNLYHHPSNETIDTLENLSIKYYNTQTSGTICYIFGRNDYSTKVYLT